MTILRTSDQINSAVKSPRGVRINKIDRYGWKLVDKPGEFALISKHELAVDQSYQRNLTELRANAIASEWSWASCLALGVALRPDGNWFVFEGQHRLAAALKRDDIDLLPCLVFEMETQREEATAFLLANTNRRPMTMTERFRALIMKNDLAATKVSVMLASAGVRLVNGGYHPGTITCAAALLELMNEREDTLRRVWSTIQGLVTEELLTAKLLFALVYVEEHLANSASLCDPRWRERIRKVGIAKLRDSVQKSIAYHGKYNYPIAADGVVIALNQNIRGERLELEK